MPRSLAPGSRPLPAHQLVILRCAFAHVRRTQKFPDTVQIAAESGVQRASIAHDLHLLEKRGLLHHPRRGEWAFTRAGLLAARP